MVLRGIDFGPAWLGSGAAGFFGEGYWFHTLYASLFPKAFCPDEFTFVAKTTTIESRLGKEHGQDGYMVLKENLTPKDHFPDCIVSGVRGFVRGEMLNAVGLAGPGAQQLFACGEWERIMKPFLFSFMTTRKGEDAIRDMMEYRSMLRYYLSCFHGAPVGLQINLSCPNAGVDLDQAARDACEALDIFAPLEIPLVPKFNVLMSVDVAKRIAEHPACDAIHISNTIPYGKLPEKIDWWLGETSPLARENRQYGGGGLSGAQLLWPVYDWVALARSAGVTKPINAGGGILCWQHVDRMKEAGANGISIATAVALRPWRMRSIMERAHEVFSTKSEGR